MAKQHKFYLKNTWTGNRGTGTSGYTDYGREHTISINGKPDMFCSADPVFQGDGSKYNPEDLYLASLSACHKLWYLHLCADAGIIVTEYEENAEGTLSINDEGIGKFTDVLLNIKIRITDLDKKVKAIELHEEANRKCFIANSSNFKVRHNCNVEINE